MYHAYGRISFNISKCVLESAYSTQKMYRTKKYGDI
jgi:hypothetical protein